MFVCDGVNGGCCQSHSRVPLALGKDQNALLQVCVCVCVCVCFYVQQPLTQRCPDVIMEQRVCVCVCVCVFVCVCTLLFSVARQLSL